MGGRFRFGGGESESLGIVRWEVFLTDVQLLDDVQRGCAAASPCAFPCLLDSQFIGLSLVSSMLF